jgi:hypothetical protein
MVARVRVKKVKLEIRPIMIPIGRHRPRIVPVDKTSGSTGSMHGEIIVKNPERKANVKRIIIYNLVKSLVATLGYRWN